VKVGPRIHSVKRHGRGEGALIVLDPDLHVQRTPSGRALVEGGVVGEVVPINRVGG
jgi:hypothetical protein